MKQLFPARKALTAGLSGMAVLLAAALATQASAQQGSATDDDLIARGAYLATAGDCAACHTADHGRDFAGGKGIATPLGTIFASNITPSKSAGIGDWSEEDFARALRRGVSKDGSNLYPAMPYTAYAGMTDADVKALYAYLQQGVKPVDTPAPETSLPFPFSLRFSMKVWNLMFLDTRTFTPDPNKSADWNRGAYLAQTLAHCSTCHTPRNLLMAEKSDEQLAGASLGTWYAPNITSDRDHGIGGWTADELKSYLATGRSGNGSQAGGPMLEAIDKSLSKLSPADISALATYISSIPAEAGDGAAKMTTATQKIDNDLALISNNAEPGAELYDRHCATCHASDGAGGHGLPALAGNAALNRPSADNAVMAVLDGLTPGKGQAMPAFAARMDDRQVATLVNYLQKSFGNPEVQTDADRVGELRSGGAPSALPELARTGMIIGVVVVVLLILAALMLIARRRRAR